MQTKTCMPRLRALRLHFQEKDQHWETRHLRKPLLLTHKKFQENELCVRESMCSKVAQTLPRGRLGRHQHPVPGKSPEPLHLVTCLVTSVFVTVASVGWSRDAAQYPIGLRLQNNPAPGPAVPGGELV